MDESAATQATHETHATSDDAQRVTIAEVTRANWRAALGLAVAPEQQRFIADYAPIAALGLAKAYIRPGARIWTPYAFYAHDPRDLEDAPDAAPDPDSAMIGFTMLAHQPESAETCWIFHFFIDQRFQGRGYGAAALRRLISLIRERHPQCRAIQLTAHPENRRAQQLYTRAGFRPTGALLDGEPQYRLDWDPGNDIQSGITTVSQP